MIKEEVPQYEIKIGTTDQSGYIDPIHDDIATDVASQYASNPHFLDRHETAVNFQRPVSSAALPK